MLDYRSRGISAMPLPGIPINHQPPYLRITPYFTYVYRYINALHRLIAAYEIS
jgi:hypothetical protein